MNRRGAAGLDLEATLHSGQAFRWVRQPSGWHDGFVGPERVRLRVRGDVLEWGGDVGRATVERYLRLDGSHETFLREVVRDAPLEAALGRFPGLRLLAQDPWELLVSYILSANSNVAKISRTIEGIARLAGEPSDGAGGLRHRFPGADAVAELTETDLRSTGMGYRAPYVRATARRVVEGGLDPARLPGMNYEDAREALLECAGVGPKVADCVLLYGCGHVGAFPVDVWMERVLRERYFPRKRMNHAAWGAWARGHFGPWAGYAQHFLFHDRRTPAGAPVTRTAVARPRAAQRRPRA